MPICSIDILLFTLRKSDAKVNINKVVKNFQLPLKP